MTLGGVMPVISVRRPSGAFGYRKDIAYMDRNEIDRKVQ